MLLSIRGTRNVYSRMMGMQTTAATLEISKEYFPKNRTRTSTDPIILPLGLHSKDSREIVKLWNVTCHISFESHHFLLQDGSQPASEALLRLSKGI